MLTIVLWLWKDPECRTQYRPEHVLRIRSQIAKNLTIPHRFVVFTDWDSLTFLDDTVFCSLWDDWRDLHYEPGWRREFPQCYVRLKIFAKEMRSILGDRFVSIDLDCVVTGNLDEILSRKEDFLIYHRPILTSEDRLRPYQASMIMMDTGCRKEVWEDFKGIESIKEMSELENRDNFLQTDQGWILYKLGPKEKGWTMEDGVYSWPWMQKKGVSKLPEGAKIVFFNGKCKPWDYGWMK